MWGCVLHSYHIRGTSCAIIRKAKFTQLVKVVMSARFWHRKGKILKHYFYFAYKPNVQEVKLGSIEKTLKIQKG